MCAVFEFDACNVLEKDWKSYLTGEKKWEKHLLEYL